MDHELRSFDAEFRVDEDAGTIEGYGAVYNSWSEPIAGFRERFLPGSFSDSLASKSIDLRSLFNHDPNYVLGRRSAGTLEASEDDKGVYFRATPPDTGWARDLRVSVERRDITQASIQFRVASPKDEEWIEEGKSLKREVSRAKLYELGPVTFPAYRATKVQARAGADSGLDNDAINIAIIKLTNGVELRDADIAVLQGYVDWLQAQLPSDRMRTTDASASPSGRLRTSDADQQDIEYEYLRRQLRLRELLSV